MSIMESNLDEEPSLRKGWNKMIQIRTYTDADRDSIIDLVLHCQNDGTRPPVTVKDQPELLDIKEKYINQGGCFWVAEDDGRLAGTIGLMNCNSGIAVLKKFFVYEPYRSAPHHLGRRLYAVLMDFACGHGIRQLILDTPKNTDRAHDFYEKAGFRKIEKGQLPVAFDYPYDDCDFFCLDIDSHQGRLPAIK